MSNDSKQSRTDQYDGSVGANSRGTMKMTRSFKMPKLSGNAGNDPIQPNNRGNQGQK